MSAMNVRRFDDANLNVTKDERNENGCPSLRYTRVTEMDDRKFCTSFQALGERGCNGGNTWTKRRNK